MRLIIKLDKKEIFEFEFDDIYFRWNVWKVGDLVNEFYLYFGSVVNMKNGVWIIRY